MSGFFLDLRQALRSLLRAPALLTVALLTIALGVGANVAMFSVLHSVVMSPLPYPDSERIVQLWPEKRWSVDMLNDVRERVDSYEATAAVTSQTMMLLGEGPAEVIEGALVSAQFFDVLAIRPQLGAGFEPGDALAERGPVVVLSHELWQSRFNGDPTVIGRTVRLAGMGVEERTVVGVMGAGLPRPERFWTPIVEVEGQPGYYGPYGLEVIGRLRPEIPAERASAELRGLTEELTPVHPTQFRPIRYSPVDVVPALEAIVRNVRAQLLVLMGAVAFVLLIACTNVANLLLARAQVRQREIAVRAALGSSRGRIVRYIFAESAVIGLLGGGAGLLAAYYTLPLLANFLGAQIPRAEEIGINGAVLLFALALSLGASLIFGVVPAWRASRTAPAQLLRSGGRGQSQTRSAGRLNDVLVGGEIALCLVLLAGAGLMLKSMWQLMRVDTGLVTENILTVQYSLPPGRYEGPEEIQLVYQRMEEELGAIPGVASVAFSTTLPLSGGWSGLPYQIEGQPEEEVSRVVPSRVVTPAFFQLFGLDLVEGRLFGLQDVVPDAEGAVVVNEAFARQHWPEGDALGGRIMTAGGNPIGTIVGVVRDARMGLIHEEPTPQIFSALVAPSSGFAILRGAGAVPTAESVVRTLRQIEPDIAARNVRTMDEVIAGAAAETRFFTRLLLGFAAIALLLGLVGVYGVMSYAVTRRTRELGVRLALGASPRAVTRRVVGRALGPLGAGIAAGLLGAVLLTRVLAGLMYEVNTIDPWVLGSVALLLVATGIAAALVPAARAGRVSPLRALEAE
jgi:putative ABC transport system permease protein